MKTMEDARSRIEAANREFISAFKRGDADGISKLYTKEAQLLPANSDFVKGTEAIGKFWRGAMDMGLTDAVLQTIEVEEHGDTAIEVGQYKLFVAGGIQADQGKYIVVWKNEAGPWKLHRDIWTTSQPKTS